MKAIRFFGGTGMALVIIGLTGLIAASPEWYMFYLFILSVAAGFMLASNILINRRLKNLNK